MNCCFQIKIRSPEHCLKLERCQGPPNMNKVKQYEIELSLRSNKMKNEDLFFSLLIMIIIMPLSMLEVRVGDEANKH